MFRKIMTFLKEWRENKQRRPLIMQGARQVGKTYSILEFGRNNYDNVVYFNFEINPHLCKTFEEDMSPEYLLPILSHIAGRTIVKERTLIVLDDVQLCERALTSLKYFYENAPEYHIIVAGNFAKNRGIRSFSVDEVDIKTLYPMDFEEFLYALGEDDLVTSIKTCFETSTPMPLALHEKAVNLYRQYLVIGGLPECIRYFVETRDYAHLRYLQNTILAGYLQEYNLQNKIKQAGLIFDSIAVHLSKFENMVEWLCLSGIVSKVYKAEQIKKPLEDYRDVNSFKVYVSDVGLLCAKNDLTATDVLCMADEIDSFKNIIFESYVNMQLTINNYNTYYLESEQCDEMCFIIQRNGELIPIEVNADNNLRRYLELYQPDYVIEVSEKNFSVDNNLKSVPFYAVFCI